MRRCFDVTLKGFNGDTDETDELVKWVIAPSREVLDQWLAKQGLTDLVQTIDEMEHASEYTFADGVDVVLDEHSGAICEGVNPQSEWHKEVTLLLIAQLEDVSLLEQVRDYARATLAKIRASRN